MLALFSLARLWFSMQPCFGGENITGSELNASNWHHQDITVRAAHESGLGFEEPAIESLQWHSDMIDSYLYNPFFWAKGGVPRVMSALMVKPHLERLHFDDLTSTAQISIMWQRYLSGTVAGLVWAANAPGGPDLPAAHNLIGLSLHAQQDFYAHSNWVDDPVRRTKTWFDAVREANSHPPPYSLYTGTYELPDHLGVKPHGKIAPACGAFELPGVKQIMHTACMKVSPLNKFSVCVMYDKCRNAEPVSPDVLGVPLPEGLAYVEPPGIALDSHWQAPIARQVRDIAPGDPITADELFETAKELALRSSIDWLQKLETLMTKLGLTDFWASVKTTDTAPHRERQFEGHATLPMLFLSSGTYPPPPTDELYPEYGDWYLWIQITTGDSGTNDYVYVSIPGEREKALLDHMPDASFLLDFNDFKAGSAVAYTQGPTRELPTELTFHLEGRDVLDVAGALSDAVEGLIDDALEAISDFFMSLISGHADEIGSDKISWSANELAGIGPDPVPFMLEADGGDEGHYQLRCSIRRTNEGTDPGRAGTITGDWAEYQVTIDELHCVAESDELSPEDEVFVLALLVNMTDDGPNSTQKMRTRVIDIDEDAKDVPRTVGVGYSFAPVRVPKAFARLTMPVAFLESDQESGDTRDELRDGFASRVEARTRPGIGEVAKTLGAVGPGSWTFEHLRVFAFKRPGAEASALWLYDGRVGQRLGPGGTLTIPFPPPPPAPLWSVQG